MSERNQAQVNMHAITPGEEPLFVPQRIPLTNTEQMAIRQSFIEQQVFEMNRKGVIIEIAARVGLKPEQIGTEYALFADALVQQPVVEQPVVDPKE